MDRKKGGRSKNGGNFTARTGYNKGGVEWVEKEEVVMERKKKSKDRKVNRKEKALVEFL